MIVRNNTVKEFYIDLGNSNPNVTAEGQPSEFVSQLIIRPLQSGIVIPPERLSFARRQLNVLLGSGELIIAFEDPFDPLVWWDTTTLPNFPGSEVFSPSGFQLIPREYVFNGFSRILNQGVDFGSFPKINFRGTDLVVTVGPADTANVEVEADAFIKRTIISSASYLILNSDFLLAVRFSNSPVTVTLPALAVTGRNFVIKDEIGIAATFPITVMTLGGATIDGLPSLVINQRWAAARIYSTGTQWHVW